MMTDYQGLKTVALRFQTDKINCSRWFLVGVVLTVALLPRVVTLGRAYTTDEAHHWVGYRSSLFLESVRHGHFADTMITGHPGVTTMWLGSMGLLLEQGLQAIGWLGTPSFETHLLLMRLPLACATALIIAIAFVQLQRLLGTTVALLAALFWACDPFLVAHSRILHLDALLSMLILLALLAVLVACFGEDGHVVRPQKRYLVLSGIASGLALLTKSSALILLPISILTLVIWYWHASYHNRKPRLRVLFFSLSLRASVAIITIFICWPALWVSPVQAMGSVFNEILFNGGAPHKDNFLLGSNFLLQDPGVLYYPVTLLSRTTPWCAAGLVLCLFAAARYWGWLKDHAMPLLIIGATALLLIVALSSLPKKFDRYALPSVPLIHILAAVGIYWFELQLPVLMRWVTDGLLTFVVAATLIKFHPYELSYYSPLTGGTKLASDVVLVGFGEGLDEAADWLNSRPDIMQGNVATWSPPTLRPYLNTDVLWQGSLIKSNYLVVYIHQVQTGKEYQYVSTVHNRCPPDHVVQLNDIDYAWIYQMPLLQTINPPGMQFDDTVKVDDYTITPPFDCTCQPVSLTLVIEPLENQPLPARSTCMSWTSME